MFFCVCAADPQRCHRPAICPLSLSPSLSALTGLEYYSFD